MIGDMPNRTSIEVKISDELLKMFFNVEQE